MKKNISYRTIAISHVVLLTILIFSQNSVLLADDTGSSFLGGIFGGMMGGLFSAAVTNNSGKSDLALEKARAAERTAEEVARKHDRIELERLRSELEKKIIEKGGKSSTENITKVVYVLLIAVIVLLLITVVLGAVILRRKNE